MASLRCGWIPHFGVNCELLSLSIIVISLALCCLLGPGLPLKRLPVFPAAVQTGHRQLPVAGRALLLPPARPSGYSPVVSSQKGKIGSKTKTADLRSTSRGPGTKNMTKNHANPITTVGMISHAASLAKVSNDISVRTSLVSKPFDTPRVFSPACLPSVHTFRLSEGLLTSPHGYARLLFCCGLHCRLGVCLFLQ